MNDEDWLKALHGERLNDPGRDAQAVSRLHRAIAAANAKDRASPGRAAEFEVLLIRLRREGLLEANIPRQVWRPVAAAVAVVGVLGVMVASWLPQTPGRGHGNAADDGAGEVLRGAPTLTVKTAEPSALASRVEAILRMHGATVHRAPLQDGGVELRATIPQALLGKAQADLAQLGLAVPADGRLAVDIVPQ